MKLLLPLTVIIWTAAFALAISNFRRESTLGLKPRYMYKLHTRSSRGRSAIPQHPQRSMLRGRDLQFHREALRVDISPFDLFSRLHSRSPSPFPHPAPMHRQAAVKPALTPKFQRPAPTTRPAKVSRKAPPGISARWAVFCRREAIPRCFDVRNGGVGFCNVKGEYRMRLSGIVDAGIPNPKSCKSCKCLDNTRPLPPEVLRYEYIPAALPFEELAG